jgi:excisionase family DNA binding protein
MLTPTEVAKLWRVRYTTVIEWIKSGKLRAMNTSTGPRPRYRIKPDDLAALEEKLVAAPQAPVARRVRESSFTRWI